MNEDNEDKLATNIRQSLDDSVESLDTNTLAKIRQIRAQAVARADVRQRHWSNLMTGALATACVITFAVMVLLRSPAPTSSVPLDDLDLISSSESLELYEDLEFYEWLEEDVLQS
jgi:hypothetical protein